MVEEMTPERIPQITLVSKVSSEREKGEENCKHVSITLLAERASLDLTLLVSDVSPLISEADKLLSYLRLLLAFLFLQVGLSESHLMSFLIMQITTSEQ